MVENILRSAAASSMLPFMDVADCPWMAFAIAELGIKEVAGKQHNPRIIEYFTKAGNYTNDETAWCSAFVNWCIEKEGIKGTNNAGALSWRNWGFKLETPRFGCVTVFNRYNKAKQLVGGHVGFYVGEEGKDILVLGGNQGDEVCIKPYPKAHWLDYRWNEDLRNVIDKLAEKLAL